MLLNFKSNVYDLAEAYFDFWYWAGFWAGFDWPLGGFCDKDLATLSQREAAGRTSYGSVGSIIAITQKSSRGRQKLRTIALKLH